MNDIDMNVAVIIVMGIGQALTWLLVGWQIWRARRWLAEWLDRRSAETASLLSRLCEQQRELGVAAEWLKRHEQVVVAAARGAAGPGQAERKSSRAEDATETGGGRGAPEAEAAKTQVGRCIRCGVTIRAERVQPYCPDCFRAWVREGRPERPEPYCARCGRKTGAVTFRHIRCEGCAAPKRPALAVGNGHHA